MKPLKVYIAGKYSADNILDCLKNIGRGEMVAAELFEKGFAPFAPWFDKSFVLYNPDGNYTKQMFYDASLVWMECSDVVFVISGMGEGGGVDMEIERAESLCIPVFDDLAELIRWKEVVSL